MTKRYYKSLTPPSGTGVNSDAQLASRIAGWLEQMDARQEQRLDLLLDHIQKLEDKLSKYEEFIETILSMNKSNKE